MAEPAEVIDPVETETPVKPRRKYRRRKGRRAAAAPRDEKPAEFAGMTMGECPMTCEADKCCISARAYCAHPRKGGLQGSDLSNPAALDRFARAKRSLAILSLDKGKR